MVWRFPKRSLDYRVTITDAKGIVIYDSLGRDLGRDNSRWNDVYRTLRGEYGARSSPEVPGEEGDTVMHVAAPVYDPTDGRTLIGVLSLAQPNRSIDPFIAASQRAIIERGAWLIGLSALVGVLVTMWLTTGLGQLSRYARGSAPANRCHRRGGAATRSATWARHWKQCAASWRARPTSSSTCSR